jgi:adenosylmethionine-8-amino-7-oxononanoate aminotransferase
MTPPTPTPTPIWHPFTQHALRARFPTAIRSEGAYIYTSDGRRIIDAIASWWVITHGHRHPRIVEAIQASAATLDQVIFAEFTHEPAERLAAEMLKLTPEGLRHVFFSDSGSTSVEVALKMALGYWHHIGEPRRRVIVMEHSYHGDTIGTMSVGARGTFTESYEPLLFEVERIPFPTPGRERATLDALNALCTPIATAADPAARAPAALIVEPMVLGAGGMLMYGADLLAALRRICQQQNVLFIADEVMTGWGRTGQFFACSHASITPDIACYSKGLTGGALPLAVTLCTPKIYDAHYSSDRRRTFFHSSSFTANPIACAAALANLEIWRDEPVRERITALTALQTQHLARFEGHPRLENLRQTGTITAMEVCSDDPGYLSALGPRLHAAFQSANVLLRPLGNTIYVMPPYCITPDDLDEVYAAITSALASL